MRKVIVQILAAFIASTMLAACGNKKTTSAPGAPAPAAQKAPVDAGTNPPSSNTGSNAPVAKPPTIKPPKPPKTPVVGDPANPGPVVMPSTPVKPPAPKPNPGPAPVNPPAAGPMDPSQQLPSYDPSIPTFDEHQAGKKVTGAVTPEGLLYTGIAADDLLPFLQSKNLAADVSDMQRQANLKAAGQIVTVDLKSDSFTQDAVLSLQVVEPTGLKIYNLVSVLTAESAQPLKVVKQGTTGSQIISGTIKCVDSDGSCSSVVARLTIGAAGNKSVAYVVLRQTNADLYVQFKNATASSANKDLNRFVDLISNTSLDKDTEARFDNYQIRSFEVVNGRSGFKVEMKARNSQFIGFKGSLMAPEIGTVVSAPVGRLLEIGELNADVKKDSSLKFDVLNTFAETKMVNNNGLGQIRLQVKMRKVGAAPQDVFNLIFSSKPQTILPLDENLLN